MIRSLFVRLEASFQTLIQMDDTDRKPILNLICHSHNATLEPNQMVPAIQPEFIAPTVVPSPFSLAISIPSDAFPSISIAFLPSA
uniref:Uncharacterized protein n=1 Tax=Caenorhabditis tropicalis TaxID=1561998 RepID=A0A1I7UQW9_9PELO